MEKYLPQIKGSNVYVHFYFFLRNNFYLFYTILHTCNLGQVMFYKLKQFKKSVNCYVMLHVCYKIGRN